MYQCITWKLKKKNESLDSTYERNKISNLRNKYIEEPLFLVVVFLGLAFLSDNRFLFEDFKPLGVYILIYIFDKNLLLL